MNLSLTAREPPVNDNPIQVENDILGHLTMEIFLSKTGSGNLVCYQIIVVKSNKSLPLRQGQGSEALPEGVLNCHYQGGHLYSVHPFSQSTVHKKYLPRGCDVWSKCFSLCKAKIHLERRTDPW